MFILKAYYTKCHLLMIVLVAAFVLFIFINIAVFLRCCRFSVKKDLHINMFTTPKDIIALTGKIQTTSVFLFLSVSVVVIFD